MEFHVSNASETGAEFSRWLVSNKDYQVETIAEGIPGPDVNEVEQFYIKMIGSQYDLPNVQHNCRATPGHLL